MARRSSYSKILFAAACMLAVAVTGIAAGGGSGNATAPNAATLQGSGPYCFKAQAEGANAGKADFHMFISADFQTAGFAMKTFSNQQLTMSHLHQGAAGVNGPPVVGLVPLIKLGNPAQPQLLAPPLTVEGDVLHVASFDASFLGATFAGLQLDALANAAANGTIYVNWHSVAQPDGVIRGQLAQVNNCAGTGFATPSAIAADASL